MIQYIILGYLIFEILRLSQRPDVNSVKFAPPTPEQQSQPAPPPAAVPQAQVTQAPVPIPEAPKSEETAKSG